MKKAQWESSPSTSSINIIYFFLHHLFITHWLKHVCNAMTLTHSTFHVCFFFWFFYTFWQTVVVEAILPKRIIIFMNEIFQRPSYYWSIQAFSSSSSFYSLFHRNVQLVAFHTINYCERRNRILKRKTVFAFIYTCK